MVVGYVTSDLSNHPVGRCLAALMQHHRLERFLIHVYSTAKHEDNSVMQRVKRAAHTLVEVEQQQTQKTADRIAAARVHILVDLNGYTKHERSDIFSLKPGMYMAKTDNKSHLKMPRGLTVVCHRV